MKVLLLLPVALALFASSRTAEPAPPAGEHDWVIDPVHSSVVFKIKHADTSNFYGVFKSIKGEFTLDPKDATASKVAVEIAADSVDTRSEGRDKHVKGPDFFDAVQYPAIKFTSTKVTASGEDFVVAGELELRGKTQALEVTLHKVGEGQMRGPIVGYETSFTIKRSAFGMDSAVAQRGLSDEVEVIVSVEAKGKR